jgi:hypothetical protein
MESNNYPVTTHEIVDVVAKLSRTSTDTGTEAKLFIGDEAGPFVILSTRAEAVAVDESSNCGKKRIRLVGEGRKNDLKDVLGLPLPSAPLLSNSPPSSPAGMLIFVKSPTPVT